MTDTVLAGWKQRVEDAKRDILSPLQDGVPDTLIAMAETQLSHAIEDVELLLLKNPHDATTHSTILVHVNRVAEAGRNESFSVIQNAWNSTHVTDSCQRFVDRYTGILKERAAVTRAPSLA